MRWFETPNIDFVGKRKVAYMISGTLFLAALAIIITKGLQYGIDFKGGSEFVYKFSEPVNTVQLRGTLTEPLGTAPEVKLFGSDTEVLIRTDNTASKEDIEVIIENTLDSELPNITYESETSNYISPRFGDELKSSAAQAVIYAIAIIFLYILIRFRNWTFSLGAVAALVHDVVITLGIFTILNDLVSFSLLIDQNIIAAFLTIVGYSLNDTVVVFDRIRENSIVHKGMEYFPMVNKSLNDTLSRTVITSVTTLFVVSVLFIFGGEVLKGLSFALIIGVVLGTYSSLFVASPLVLELDKRTRKTK
ncbi:MAG: protein translocase subunit SecF [Balneolaceae bacterium]|nr:protein translocase subunit SecF [Balneolaceae bacterium]MBO6544938.1 protein translocase subunit SecF [Balneolaceae bacterium]MBO6646334.1 protein translocase subunit SecF [Balneolaceae bacterium]